MSEWKMADNETGMKRLDNWHAHVISDRHLTPTALYLLNAAYLLCARHNAFIVPIRDIVSELDAHDFRPITKRTLKRAFVQVIERGYVLLVGNEHLRINPVLCDNPPARWSRANTAA
jgi:hypothetical protein